MLSESELSTLHFQCQACGYCCAGDSGYIFLTAEDLDSILEHLKISQQIFIEKYCHWVMVEEKEYLSIREEESIPRCVFLDEANRCRIYGARPLQCRTYPFWPRIVKSLYAWKAEAKNCPGMGQGPAVDPLSAGEKIIAERNAHHICREKKRS